MVYKLVRFCVIANLIAFASLYLVERTTAFFGLRYWQDYAFFVLFILWGIATLLYMYPPGIGVGHSGEPLGDAEKLADVSNEKVRDTFLREDANHALVIRFLISGIPPLIMCIALHWFGK
ncbi:hypothetical protein [Vibrio olivae]|uniref:DUF3899 domain-containing protein n=1 Tax=Vibrio olivae TaxID=1243002 RepID=A0ABV5HUR1_9VIBR